MAQIYETDEEIERVLLIGVALADTAERILSPGNLYR